jgi:hypothetical protein
MKNQKRLRPIGVTWRLSNWRSAAAWHSPPEEGGPPNRPSNNDLRRAAPEHLCQSDYIGSPAKFGVAVPDVSIAVSNDRKSAVVTRP